MNLKHSLVALAVCMAVFFSVRSFAQGVRAELMASETLSGPRSFCVAVGVKPQKEIPQQDDVPRVTLSGRFQKKVSGFLEVDGKRVDSWIDKDELVHTYRNVKDGVTYRFTVSVESPVSVQSLVLTGSPLVGIVELRKVNCKTQ